MPRRREVPKREVLPDPLYQSQLVTKFINCVMERGKKSTAESIFYGAMKQIEQKTSDDPLKTAAFACKERSRRPAGALPLSMQRGTCGCLLDTHSPAGIRRGAPGRSSSG